MLKVLIPVMTQISSLTGLSGDQKPEIDEDKDATVNHEREIRLSESYENHTFGFINVLLLPTKPSTYTHHFLALHVFIQQLLFVEHLLSM